MDWIKIELIRVEIIDKRQRSHRLFRLVVCVLSIDTVRGKMSMVNGRERRETGQMLIQKVNTSSSDGTAPRASLGRTDAVRVRKLPV